MFLCVTLIKSWVAGAVLYHDFITELNKAGLTVRRFAELMGMQPNSVSNYKKTGEIPMHLAVIASLLAELSSRNIDYSPVFDRLEPSRNKPRGAAKSGKFAGNPQGILELDK
ncbi:XRE family transcriptional regulator [Agrobacterium rhizogenes]|nr:XRE family transcriptional regulator [Rhizobium rhizogenes]NTJ79384.1 XRE family transcriptional regulator [Rhizobium rhizogenes]